MSASIRRYAGLGLREVALTLLSTYSVGAQPRSAHSFRQSSRCRATARRVSFWSRDWRR
jgi:hypothetical protein